MIETTSPRETSPSSGRLLQEDRRRELGQERLGQVELDVEALQAREHLDLHLREDLPAQPAPLAGWGSACTGRPPAADLCRAQRGQRFPVIPCGRRAVGPTTRGLPRDIVAVGSSLGSRL